MEKELFLTVIEVAEILKVKRRIIYQMLKEKRIKGIRLSLNNRSVWRIPVDEIKSLYEEAFDDQKQEEENQNE